MAFHLYEDTWETSTTTGTGDYILAGAVSGWRAFSAQYANGDTCWYSAYDGTNFEEGLGTFNSGANSLIRTTVYRSTNSNTAVSWSAGTRNIVVAPLGITFEQLIDPSKTGYPKRTAANTWAYDLAGQISNTTATNDSASAGNLGEIISSSVAVGSAVALSNGVAANVTSISLTAGDWDVSGLVVMNPAGTTTMSAIVAGITTTTATLPGLGGTGTGNTRTDAFNNGTSTAAGLSGPNAVVGPTRMSLSGTTTVFLVAFCSFAVSTNAAYGYIRARRVR